MIVEIIGRSSEVLSEITVIGPSETSSEQLFGHDQPKKELITGSIARSANLPVFSLLRGRF